MLQLVLTLILLTWKIWRAPVNASQWQMGFNSALEGLNRYIDKWDRIHLAMDRDEWRPDVNSGMSHGVGFLDQVSNGQCLVKHYFSWS